MNRSIWPSCSQIVEKPWGYERQWSTMLPLDGKVLYINIGARTSMKMFEAKNEVLFVQHGTITAVIADESIFYDDRIGFRELKLNEGDVLNIQAGCPYRLEATDGDAIVVEISNGQAPGCVRFDDDFGRKIHKDRTHLIQRKLERLEDDRN
jgi:mannose-6-phosphate isomerase-like protein (cupin superfamily)